MAKDETYRPDRDGGAEEALRQIRDQRSQGSIDQAPLETNAQTIGGVPASSKRD